MLLARCLAFSPTHARILRTARPRLIRYSAPATTSVEEATSGTVLDYGGIPHVAVLVSDADAALHYYTNILLMVEDSQTLDDTVKGTCVRVGEQVSLSLYCSSTSPSSHCVPRPLHPGHPPSGVSES